MFIMVSEGCEDHILYGFKEAGLNEEVGIK